MGLNVLGYQSYLLQRCHPVSACMVTKDLPTSPRFSPYDFLSRREFSTPTTWQPMVEFYLLTFSRFPPRKKEHKFFPSLPGSRLTIFDRYASSALLQLDNQWLYFTYSRCLTFSVTEKKNTNYGFHKNRTHDFRTSR